jgi:D-sedoheptulose 7-phosphate isomerase
MLNTIKNELLAHKKTIEILIENNLNDIENACNLAVETLQKGNKILLFGNGGSAADAQHIAAELTGRFVTERIPLPGIALTTDTSALTAIANDYGFDVVFSRQVQALARKGDLLIGISTSGNSQNVLKAFEKGKEIGCKSLALSGRDGGKMKETADVSIIIADQITARIQEMHILIGHIICQAIDEAYKNK